MRYLQINQRTIRFLLFSAFALLWGGTMLFIARFGTDVPYWDEWRDTVPFITGDRPLTLEELWKPHFEHRILWPRLIEICVLGVTGNSFQAMHVFNGFVAGATALLLLCLAGAIRSRSHSSLAHGVPEPRFVWSLTDAFIPLTLLHLAHYSNLLWGFQIQFYGTAFLLALLLWGVFLWEPDAPLLTRNAVVFVALPLAALPFFGSNGLVFAAALMIPVAVRCVKCRRNKTLSDSGQVFIVAALCVALAMTMVFILIPSPPAATPTKDAVLSARIATEALFVSLGRGAILGGAVVGVGNGYPGPFPVPIAVCWWLFWTGLMGLFAWQNRETRSRLIGIAFGYVVLCAVGLSLAESRLGGSMYLLGVILFPLLVFGNFAAFLVGVLALFRRAPEERDRILAILAFFFAVIVIAVAIGIARAIPPGIGNGLASRYTILTAFAPIVMYFFATRYAKPGTLLALLCPILFLQSLIFLPNNTYEGLVRGKNNRETLRQFRAKLEGGGTIAEMTSAGMFRRNKPGETRTGEESLSPSDEWLLRGLTQLRDAKIEPYNKLKD